MQKKTSNYLKLGGISFGVLLITTIVFLLSSLIVMLLWNAILPNLFNFPIINFWQAAGLKFLCGILFVGSKTNYTKEKD